ncbi:hypothetical protein AB0B01_04995 [Streptomyces sp. NPDC044571]|uniref:hypothetical protein n=1 Tax=Streptomyces sp. NPDC044571 TaxID=3155371 RepID=UPI0033E86F00
MSANAASAKAGSANDAAVKAAAAKSATFRSPAERSVRKAVSAPSGKGSAANAAPQSASVRDNPGLVIGLSASGTSAHGIELTSSISTSFVTAIRIKINWGDGQTETDYTTDNKTLDTKHTYAEVGAPTRSRSP